MRNGNYDLMVAPDDYPGKKYRGRYCQIHQYVYWKNTGVVARADECIHHKDGDKRNNEFENLELVKRAEHARHHAIERGGWVVRLRCPQCGSVFTRRRGRTHLVPCSAHKRFTGCSRSCSSKFSRRLEKEDPSELKQALEANVMEVFHTTNQDR